MMPFFLHDAHEEEKPDDRVEREGRPENPERHEPAHDRREESREHRHRMDVALVKNAENHIHDEEGGDNEKRQRGEELLKDEAFALQLAFHRRRQHFRGGFVDEIRHVTECDTGFGVEAEGDAGELVGVIDRLQAERLLRVVRARIGISLSPLSGLT